MIQWPIMALGALIGGAATATVKRKGDPQRKLIVDRIEGGYAVVELPNGRTVDLPLIALPKGVEEGDTIHIFTTGKSGQAQARARQKRLARRGDDIGEEHDL